MGEFFTPEEIARQLKVSARTVKRMCAAGLLGGRRAGNRWRIPASAIAAYEAGDVTPDVAVRQTVSQRTPTPIRVAPAVEEAGYVAIVPGGVPWRSSIVASPATGRARSAGTKKRTSVSRSRPARPGTRSTSTMIVAHPVPSVQQQPTAAQDYRRHVYGNCLYCMGGHWCAVRDELDYLADVEAFALMREANRG